MKSDNNRLFWILQFLGWGFYNLLSALILKDLSYQFLLFSIISGITSGVLTTSVLRYYFKRTIQMDHIGIKEILKIALASLVAAVFFGLINFGFGFLYGQMSDRHNQVEIALLEAFHSFWLVAFSSVFNIFLWVLFYWGIKFLLKYNNERIERLELNASLRQAQLNMLKGQINPHFMFNSLNNIRGLMLEDVEKARSMLTKLSEMLRYSLNMDEVNTITLEEELEIVENYMELAKIQFEDRLTFVKDIAADTLERKIPPMVVQLMVENAVKHGISNLKKGGTISLRSHLEDSDILIVVKNSGKLKISESATRLGIRNIEQRLRLLYGNQATFKLEQAGEMVSATIKLPVL